MATAVCSSESSNPTIGDHLRLRKPTNQHPPIMQSTRCKSAISSLLLSTFSSTNSTNNETTHKKRVKGSSLRGFGCTAQPEVSVPGVIRSSADWEESRRESEDKKKKKKKKMKKKSSQQLQGVMMMDDSIPGVQDLWCGADSAVDCVRPLSSARPKIDLDKLHHSNRQRASYSSRQRVNLEHFAAIDLDSAFDNSLLGPDVFEARYYHHLRNRSPEGLAEILMFQNGLLVGKRSSGLDRYRDWRLDVDNMTYEELLELGEKIGHVSTGLGEDKIGRCLRKTKLSVLDKLSSQSHEAGEMEGKCSICQEEYEAEDEMGKLECGHAYHLNCIKQWLARKNACPVCKVEASC